MKFGQILDALEEGRLAKREGWNGHGMFIFLVPGSTFEVNRPPLLGIYELGRVIKYKPHIDMKTADGSVVPWLASQSDILADDWVVMSAKPYDTAVKPAIPPKTLKESSDE